jgi:hypothetical protein
MIDFNLCVRDKTCIRRQFRKLDVQLLLLFCLQDKKSVSIKGTM